MDKLYELVNTVNNFLTDYFLVFLLVITGLYFTVKTGFVQIKCFGEGMRQMFGGFSLRGKKADSGMSSFQALTTAVASQVGTGSIVGASSAILIGGPGAIFWMWIIAFFGMATIYAEAVLAQKTKVTRPDGSVSGGPVYYITTAFSGKIGRAISVCFAIFAVIAFGFIGTMVQSNSISVTCETAFGIPGWVIGIIVALAAGFVFVGGVSRLASVTEKLVPIMAVLYLLGGIVLIILKASVIPESVGMIFKYAFNPSAIIGGSMGYALKTVISQGAKRGLFSNEAGLGSTPHAHAIANVKRPHDQGILAMIGVFITTFVVVTITGIAIIATLYAGDGILANGPVDGISGTNMAQYAFSSVFGDAVGNTFISICLFFFAFSTILGWNLFGKANFEYLFGHKISIVYSLAAVVFTFLGAILKNDLVWALMDLFNNFMVIFNIPALFAMSGVVAVSSLTAQIEYKKIKLAEKSEKHGKKEAEKISK